MIATESIGNDLLALEAVIALHRSDGKGLGMFPRGAFEEHAHKKWILIARDANAGIIGYLLYREARERAMVAHLCVHRDFRSKGVGRALMDKLKSKTNHLKGIGLYCRRDYEKARAAWTRYGFVPVTAKRGRGADGTELEFWWFDNNKPDLFSFAAAHDPSPKLRVVLDANVFYDLHQRDTQDSEASKALLADWLQEEIELVLTPEILVEISRADTEEKRRRSRANVSNHTVVKTEDAKVQQLITELQTCFPQGTCLRDDSDLRQIAHAIAADIPFFVTRDEQLVKNAEPLFAKYGLRALHPTDLINHLDSLRREAEYRPARLEGSRLTVNLLRADQIPGVIDRLRREPAEKISEFEKQLKHFLARPAEYECKVAQSETKQPLAILVTTRARNQEVRIAMFRLSNDSLAPTVGRALVRGLLETSPPNSLFQCTHNGLSESERAALADLGFLGLGSILSKLTVAGCVTADSIAKLVTASAAPEDLKQILRVGLETYAANPSAAASAELEKLFWPAKLKDSPTPSFVVPIQARWAQHFFDTDLAAQNLFGLRAELHLGLEGAYYCSARNTMLQHPGRVLWYVSKGPQGDGSMCVKACSRIDEVLVGKPKELFKQLSRLGVYEWRDIYELAGKDVNKPIMAFRFSMTERFSKPIDLTELKQFGVPGPIMSPREVTPQQFESMYQQGKSLS